MKPRAAQRGVALIAMLALVALGAAWFTVSKLQAMGSDYTIAKRNHNAAVLARAKQALIGHVAMQAAKQGETDPGRLPCPEAAGSAGGPLEGATQGTCTFPAIGRLPWRTLGMEKLLDANGEALWYVVASGWALGSNLVINSNCTSDATMACFTGQLTVDGTKDTVALIVAPGPAMSVAACAGNPARSQARNAPSPTMDPRDYLECYNTATASFVTRGTSDVFNDQAVKITAAELLPAIEAAIADRVEHELAPQVRATYAGGAWPPAPGGLLPFAAPFSNPTTSAMKGSLGTAQGLLPITSSETAPGSGVPCTPGANPKCDPMFVAWTGVPTLSDAGGGAVLWPTPMSSCSVTTVTVGPGTQTTRIDCSVYALWPAATPIGLNFRIAGTAGNVGMAMRQFNTAVAMTGVNAAPRSATGVLNANGSASVSFDGTAPMGSVVAVLTSCDPALAGWEGVIDCIRYDISVPVLLLADHALLDTAGTYGWFVRNKWHEVSYYAAAPRVLPNGPRACTTAVDCLRLLYDRDDGKQRGLIAIGGARIGLQARPALAAADLLEDANADGLSPFTARAPALVVNRSFNDRFAVLDHNP